MNHVLVIKSLSGYIPRSLLRSYDGSASTNTLQLAAGIFYYTIGYCCEDQRFYRIVHTLGSGGLLLNSRTFATETLNMPSDDITASIDAFIGKPGYGTVASVAYHNKPFLYISRDNWPEEPYLVKWLTQYVPCKQIDAEAFRKGAVRMDLDDLWAQAPNQPFLPLDATGGREIAEIICSLARQPH